MSKYQLDLDYAYPGIDISREELEEIVAEADTIIQENRESPEKLAVAYYKKAQCLQKIWECDVELSDVKLSMEKREIEKREKLENKQEQIKNLLEKALELSPDIPEAIMQLGKVYAALSKQEEAIDFFTRAIELKPDYEPAFNNRGNCYNKLEEHEKAIEDYTTAIQLKPDCFAAVFNRGNCYHELEEHEKAIEDYTTVIQLNPGYFPAFMCRGSCYSKLGEHEKAKKDFPLEFLKRIGEFDERTYISKRELEEIILETDAIISANEEVPEKLAVAYYKKAQCLHKLKVEQSEDELEEFEKHEGFGCMSYKPLSKHEDAIDLYTKAIEIKFDYADAFNNRGECYTALGEHKKAIEDFTAAIQIEPDAESAFYDRGKSYLQLGEYEKAIEDYTTVIQLNPDYSLAFIHRSVCYSNMGEYEKAMEDFKKAKQQYSDSHKTDEFDSYFRKCSICGLPGSITKAGMAGIGNNFVICGKCNKNNDILESIKNDNELLYQKIIDLNAEYEWLDDFILKYKNEEEIRFSQKWMTNLTINELRSRTKEYQKPKAPEPIMINNIPIHKNLNKEPLEGEVFRKNEARNVEVSNLGRVKCGDTILEQYDPRNNGYLFVDVNNISEKVYRLVAETWIDKTVSGEIPDEKSYCYNTVHHISNNGYDNRIENLMWVTEWQHAMIHPWINIDQFGTEELKLLLESYARIIIAPDDYQRIIGIVKRLQQLGDYKRFIHTNLSYLSIIDAMEELKEKHNAHSIVV